MVRILTRNDEDFYRLLGPVFGSRQIEKITRDRFYDDEGKIWYVVPNKGAASVSGVIAFNVFDPARASSSVANCTRPVRSVVAVRARSPAGVTALSATAPASVSAAVASSTTPRVSVVAGGLKKFVSPSVTLAGFTFVSRNSMSRYA